MLLSHTAVSSHLIIHCLEKAPASCCCGWCFALCIFCLGFFFSGEWNLKLHLSNMMSMTSSNTCSSFPGASRVFFRTQPCSLFCRPSPSHLTFHSRSRQPSGPKPSRQIPCLGEARISRIFYQGQARELQDPGCRSKRISFQNDWMGPVGTPK